MSTQCQFSMEGMDDVLPKTPPRHPKGLEITAGPKSFHGASAAPSNPAHC